jgi:hypothetical protein
VADCLAGALGGDFPGILTLLDLIEGHRSAFEYDWRTRFSIPLSAIGTRAMSWGEAFRLALILIADPSSQVGAATGGLAQPVSREYVALQILVDNAVQQAAKKRAQLRTLPDPFKRTKRIGGRHVGVSAVDFEKVLAAHRG